MQADGYHVCMGRRIHDFTGQRFGKLVVLRIAGRDKRQQVTFVCKCDCGKERILPGNELGKKNHPKSCGCARSAWNLIDPNRTEKRCSRCREVKPIEAFPLLVASKDGHNCYCDPCYIAYNQSKPRRSKEKINAYQRKRRQQDMNHRIASQVRSRITRAMKGKKMMLNHSKLELLGCSIPELRAHLERHFQPGMTWDNYGHKGWHMDHIRPCSSFDLTDPEQRKQCFHWTNTQPLWWQDNLHKHDKYISP